MAIALIVLAMGLENAVFQIEGGGGLGLTYMTGALVKVGQLLAVALTGGRRWAWVPNLLLWAALVLGSACGALAYLKINLAAIWFAAALHWCWVRSPPTTVSGIDSETGLADGRNGGGFAVSGSTMASMASLTTWLL